MSFIDCIQSHVSAGDLSKESADKLQKEYEGLVEKYSAYHSSLDSAAEAARKIVELKAKKAVDKKYSDLKSAKSQIEVGQNIAAKFETAKKDYAKLNKLQRTFLGGQKPTFSQYTRDFLDTVGASQQASINMIYQEILPVIKKRGAMWESDSFRSTMKDAVGHVLGKQASSAEARELGEAIIKALDLSHRLYNANGGMIGKLVNYFPQAHSSEKLQSLIKQYGDISDDAAVNKAFEDWYSSLRPKLDVDKMIDEKTGLPFTDEDLRVAMLDDFKTIATDGANKVIEKAEKGGQIVGFGGDLNVRRDKSRFYHFKGPDEYFEYNDKFGLGNDNLFDIMVGHLGVMGRDIGTMSKMGPKPDSVMRNLNLRMAQDSTQSRWWTNSMYDAITGKLAADGKESTWYRVYQAYRNQLRGAYLGSALVSAIGDPYFGVLAARRFGMPGYNMVKNAYRIFEEGGVNAESLKFAQTQSDLIMGSSINRFDEAEELGAKTLKGYEKLAHYSSEAVHRAGGLNRWTNFQELNASLSVMHQAFQERGKDFASLQKEYRQMLEFYDIGEKEWNIIRNAEPHVDQRRGAKFLTPDQIFNNTAINAEDRLKAGMAYNAYIQGFRDMAVNKPTSRARAVQTGGMQAGTLMRALISSGTMFKGFGITVMLNHTVPMYTNLVKNPRDNLLKAVGFATATTMIGALAMQMREFVKGNDPRPMDKGDFWTAAAMQGGGWGLLGDLAFADYTRFGRSPMEDALLGPIVNSAGDALRITMGNFDKALEDGDYDALNKFGNDSWKFVTRQIPGQNLWYIRNFTEAMFDSFPKHFDPDYYDKQNRRQNYMYENYGNESFWIPGDWLPERAPEARLTQ